MSRWFARSGLGDSQGSAGEEDRLARWVAGLLVGGLVLLQLTRMWPSLWLPWYHKADETVYAWEVLRFLRLDFHQRWFGGPATLYMFLTALLWSAGHRLLLLVGLTTISSPCRFAFAHLDELHVVMRFLTMGFYFGSVGLTYLLGRRLTNVCGGCVAAVLLVTLPAYCICGQSARTESMGIFFTLAAVYWTFRARETGRMKFYLWAGLAAGVATSARFHSALAALPVMLGIQFWYRPTAPVEPSDSQPAATPLPYLVLAGAFAAFFLAGALVVIGLQCGIVGAGFVTHTMLVTSPGRDFPTALRLMNEIWLGLGAVLTALFAAYFVPRLRRFAAPIVSPAVITLLAGFAGGFLLSNLTFLWQGEYQLEGIEWYSGWNDQARAGLGLAESWWQVVSYCFHVAQPEAIVGAALLLGVGLVLWRRDRALWPILLGAVMAFLSQPPRMNCLPHHVLPWMPFLAILTAYVPAALYRRAGPGTMARGAFLLAVGVATLFLMLDRLGDEQVDRSSHQARCQAVAEMTRWMEQNTPPAADVFLALDTFNEQSFYTWIESQGVTVPEGCKPSRHYLHWWYGRSELLGRTGYLAFARSDRDRLNPRQMDPARADGFEPIHTFAPGQPCSITVYRFDLRGETP